MLQNITNYMAMSRNALKQYHRRFDEQFGGETNSPNSSILLSKLPFSLLPILQATLSAVYRDYKFAYKRENESPFLSLFTTGVLL